MKTTMILLMLSIMLLSCSRVQSDELERLKQENAILKEMAGPPPASLDNFYPPKAPAPLYQIKMFEMANPFTGFILKINEGDRNAAKALFSSFREKYVSISELVPEWKEEYPSEPMDELEGLIEKGEPGMIMEAAMKVGQVCHNCHVTNMAKVQQKYHWMDFSVISLTDPVSKGDLDFRQLMMSLDMSFVGMGLELQQGEAEKALRHFENLSGGIQLMKETCVACHDSDRKYYVDAGMDELLGKLGNALRTSPPDMKQIGELSMQIGNENCFKCHLVHIPAAYAKAKWNGPEQVHH